MNALAAVDILVPGFKVQELPLELSNQNNLRFAPDGSLIALGYDGRIWKLRDTNHDGLEDKADLIWEQPTLTSPLGMAWSTHGLFISSKSKVSLLKDKDGDGRFDEEEIIASGWPPTDVGTGGVDATAVTLDAEGNVYFGLLVADYSNAYRLRKRKDLKPEEIEWLKKEKRWTEPSGPNSSDDQFSLYDRRGQRGTIQKWDPRTRQLSTVADGIRVPVGLAFNARGDLFNTDQEGETWMPDGNPFDEVNHIIAGKNYGFPPPNERWLPGIVPVAPVVNFGPQHQSACGLVFNEPREPRGTAGKTGGVALPVFSAQALFGPEEWRGDLFVAGESRGKIYRVKLGHTPSGYTGASATFARLDMLTVDLAISPKGEMYVACHSGPPDWGTGPKGIGKIFRISYAEPSAPIPLSVSPSSPTEVRVRFSRALDQTQLAAIREGARLEFGEYVSAADRLEKLKPPYAVIGQQDATPRGNLKIHQATLQDNGQSLVLTTDPHPFAVWYALTLPAIRASGATASATIDLEYNLTLAYQPGPLASAKDAAKLVSWAPTARASSGTNSRAPSKPDADWENGRALFFSAELNCAKCHRVRGEGGLAGPDLSNLIHRDAASILRDIVEPSATIHPDYVTYQVEQTEGEPVQGFVRAQTERTIQLFDADGKETVLPRGQVKSMQPTAVSLMPQGLLEGRSTNQIQELLTFLSWEPPVRKAEAIKDLIAKERSLDRELRLVLVAGKKDHGPGQHNYPAWQNEWLPLLNNSSLKVSAEKAWDWPTKDQLARADALLFYYWNNDYGTNQLADLEAFVKRGGGAMFLHSAVISDKNPERLSEIIGLSAHPRRTGYRHMPFNLRLKDRNHPITRGLPEEIHLLDEPYWGLIGDPAKVQVLGTALVDREAKPIMWTFQLGQGRVFCSITGHYEWSFSDPLYRLLVLRAVGWIAGEDPVRLEPLALPAAR